MILVDTSILIDFLKGINNRGVQEFNNIIDMDIPFGITSHIYQELLQGVSNKKDFNLLKKYLDTFTFYYPKDERESYSSAAQIYFKCRKKGFTIKSTIDCLIAQIALEHNLKLLHNDKDYQKIQKITPELKAV